MWMPLLLIRLVVLPSASVAFSGKRRCRIPPHSAVAGLEGLGRMTCSSTVGGFHSLLASSRVATHGSQQVVGELVLTCTLGAHLDGRDDVELMRFSIRHPGVAESFMVPMVSPRERRFLGL